MEVVAVAKLVVDARDVVKFIYEACGAGAAAAAPQTREHVDALLATTTRAQTLLTQIDAMNARDTAPLKHSLAKLQQAAKTLETALKDFDKHRWSKFIRAPALASKINAFKDAVGALLVEYQLAMGAFHVAHSVRQEELHDEVTRGIRSLLQDSAATPASAELLLSSTPRKADGAVANAMSKRDVERLLTLLRNKDDDEEAQDAAIALCELAEADATQKVVTTATIETLVAMLGDMTRDKTRVLVAHTLHRLAGNTSSHVQTTLQKANPVPPLAALVRAGEQASEPERTAACAALSRLAALVGDLTTAFLAPAAGLVERLVELVHDGADVQQQRHAVATLRVLASHEGECVARIAACEAIPVLVDMLYVGDTPTVRFDAMDALWHMASVEANRVEIGDENAIQAIVDQVKSGDSDEHTRLGASMLAELAKDDANDQRIADAGGVEPLVKLLISGSTAQRRNAAWALAELADHRGNATQMVHVGATRALVGSLRSSVDLHRRSNSGLALARIARFSDEKAALANAIGLKSMVGLLRESRATDQKQNTAALLSVIAGAHNVQDELRGLGAIELLVNLVKDHTPKWHGMDALGALATGNKENQIKISECGGMKALFEVLAASGKGDDVGKADRDEDAVCAVKALSKIVATDELKTKVISEGRVGELVRAAEAARDSSPLQRQIIIFLASMASELKNDAAGEAASVTLLLALMKRDRPADAELESYACFTLTRVLLGTHTYAELNDFVHDLCELSVKRLSHQATRLNDVKTLHLLTSRVESTESFVNRGGVEALLVVLKDEPDAAFDLAMRALFHLVKIPSGYLMATKHHALKIISSRWCDPITDERAFAALELLHLLSADWMQLTPGAKKSVVGFALVALAQESQETSQLGSTILTLIHKEATSTNVSLHDEPYSLDTYTRDLDDLDGARTLLAHLDSIKDGEARAQTLAVLTALAKSLRGIHVQEPTVSRMAALVEFVRDDGSATVSLEAARLVASLVIAKANATEAIHAGLINAFQMFVEAPSVEIAAKVACLTELLHNLARDNDAKTTTARAAASMVEYLAVLASSADKAPGNEIACCVLINAAGSTPESDIFSQVGVAKCVTALEGSYRNAESVKTPQFQRVSAMVAAHLQGLLGCDRVFQLYKSGKQGHRACIIRLVNDAAKAGEKAKGRVKSGLGIDKLLDVLDDGIEDEKMAAAEAVVTLIDDADSSHVKVCASFASLLKMYQDKAFPIVWALIQGFSGSGNESALEKIARELLQLALPDKLPDKPDASSYGDENARTILCAAMKMPGVKDSARVMTVMLNACGQKLRACGERLAAGLRNLQGIYTDEDWTSIHPYTCHTEYAFVILNHMVMHNYVAVCDPKQQHCVMRTLQNTLTLQDMEQRNLITRLKRSRVEKSVASLRDGSAIDRIEIAKNLVKWMKDADDLAVAVSAGAVDAFIHFVRSSTKVCASDVENLARDFHRHLVTPNLLAERREFLRALTKLSFDLEPEDAENDTATKLLCRDDRELDDVETAHVLLAACFRVVARVCEKDPGSLRRGWKNAPSYLHTGVNALSIYMTYVPKAIADGVLELLLSIFRVSGSIQPLDSFVRRLRLQDEKATHRDVRICQSGYVAAVAKRVIHLSAMDHAPDDEQLKCVEVLNTLCGRYGETAAEIRLVAAELLRVCDVMIVKMANDPRAGQRYASAEWLILKLTEDEVIGALILEHDTILVSAFQSVKKHYQDYRYNEYLKQLCTRDDVRAKLEPLDVDGTRSNNKN